MLWCGFRLHLRTPNPPSRYHSNLTSQYVLLNLSHIYGLGMLNRIFATYHDNVLLLARSPHFVAEQPIPRDVQGFVHPLENYPRAVAVLIRLPSCKVPRRSWSVQIYLDISDRNTVGPRCKLHSKLHNPAQPQLETHLKTPGRSERHSYILISSSSSTPSLGSTAFTAKVLFSPSRSALNSYTRPKLPLPSNAPLVTIPYLRPDIIVTGS